MKIRLATDLRPQTTPARVTGLNPRHERVHRMTRGCGLALAIVALWIGSAHAQEIAVPNASFESPQTSFVDPRIDFWQKSPKPSWYDESGGFLWDQLAGVFLNVAPTNSAYID